MAMTPGLVHGTARRIFNHQDIRLEHILSYFSYYENNIGIVAIFEIFMQIFRNYSLNLIRYVNVASNVFTVLGLYWVYKMINTKKRKNGLLFYILILGFMAMSLLSTWVYSDFIALALCVWATAFIIKYIKSKKIRYLIGSLICMTIAVIARENSIIFMIAIVIYLLFTVKKEKLKKDKILRILTVCLFIIVSILPSKMLIKYVANKYELNKRKQVSINMYLYMGMSEGFRANGWYNDEVHMYNEQLRTTPKEDMTLENEIKEKLKERAKYLLKHPKYTMAFYKYKILSMWAEPLMESELYNIQPNTEPSDNKFYELLMLGTNVKILKLSQKIITYMIYTGALICVIIKRKNMSNEMLLLVLIFLGGFSFHIIWEAKSRYIIPYVVILIPLAVTGITELIKKLENIKNERQVEN